MESVVETFSVVDSMRMMGEESAPHLSDPSPAPTLPNHRHHLIVGDDEAGDKGAGQIFTSETGHILPSHPEQLLATPDHPIFEEEEDTGGGGDGGLLASEAQVITQEGKAHILAASGQVISVDLLQGTDTLQPTVTQVLEEGGLSEDADDPVLHSIKKEPGAAAQVLDDETSTIQIRVTASTPRKKDQDEPDAALSNPERAMDELLRAERLKTHYTRVDRDDPRSRLHFVKYMKREGKTIKIWECGICGKEFMHQYTLMRHLPTHTDERNFRCNQCGKAFRQMSTLSQHKATHSESRPYVCDVCQKTFSRVSTLISHKKTHTEEKQHRCHVCGKAFHQKGNLKNHLFTHTNERPYKCDVCGRGFNQSSNLQCHKAKSHADGSLNYQYVADKYKCNYCDRAFSRRAQLRQHEEYRHGVRTAQGGRGGAGPGPRMVAVNNALLRKRKIGNVRIIQLPNGDRTFQEVGANDTATRNRRTKQRSNVKSGILIEPIDTKAMHRALAAGRTPFALLKPAKGVPVVVKVQFALGSKHMLVPATAGELRAAGKFTVSSQQSGTRAVQIKVPVVATVVQRIDGEGQVHMDVEAPADDDDDIHKEEKEEIESELTVGTTDMQLSHQQLILSPSVIRPSITEPVMAGEDEEASMEGAMAGDEGIIIGAMEAGQYSIDQDGGAGQETADPISSVDLLATAVNLVSQAHMPKEELSELEGIQYLRQVSLGEYEVVGADHPQATHVMNQHGHIQQIKMVEDSNSVTMDGSTVDMDGGTVTMDGGTVSMDSGTVTMEQANISALMDALQCAGYHISQGNQQIIINSDGNAVVVDQQVQMVMDGDMEGVVGSPVDPPATPAVNLVVHEVPEDITKEEN